MCDAFRHFNRNPTVMSLRACCRYCNFMHLRPISRDLRKDLFGRYKKSKRDRDRSPGCAFKALTRADDVFATQLTACTANALKACMQCLHTGRQCSRSS